MSREFERFFCFLFWVIFIHAFSLIKLILWPESWVEPSSSYVAINALAFAWIVDGKNQLVLKKKKTTEGVKIEAK